jgi:hypothetical protein
MALIIPSETNLFDQWNLHIIQWGPAKFGDTFLPVARGDIVDRSIQVEGTFGAGTNVNIQGSNDATTTTNGNYHNLHDPFSNVIIFTSAGLNQVTEVTAWMKPNIPSGDATESLTITVCARRSFR